MGKSLRRVKMRELERASEEALIEHFVRAREAGDLEAMRAAISLFVHGRYLQLMALAMTKLPEEDAPDVVGSAIISALESLEAGRAGFRGSTPGELGGWLCQIVKRRAADYYRTKERRIEAASLDERREDGRPVHEPVALEGDPTDLLALIDAHQRVVEKLSPTHRDVITLWWEERLAASEIVRRLSESADGRVMRALTVDNVHQIISRYRARMRAELDLGVKS